MTQDATCIWQQPGWPALHYDPVAVGAALAGARRAQGTVEGKVAALGFEQRLELAAEAWSQEAVATAAIEGERLDLAAVRSSIARRLGVGKQDGPNAPRNVEGLLDIMDDAVTRCAGPRPSRDVEAAGHDVRALGAPSKSARRASRRRRNSYSIDEAEAKLSPAWES